MPYKNKADRNTRARVRRASDPEHAAKTREYMREYSKQWRQGRLEKQRAYDNCWHKAKRRKDRGEKFGKRRRIKTDEQKRTTKRANRRAFYHRHKDELNAAAKIERLTNPEKHRAYEVMRWQRDFEKRSHLNRINRAKRGGECYVTLEEWLAILRQHNFRCVYCDVVLTKDNRSMDHKIPLVRGGTNEIANLVPACFICNVRKNRKTYDEYMAQITESKDVKIRPDGQDCQ